MRKPWKMVAVIGCCGLVSNVAHALDLTFDEFSNFPVTGRLSLALEEATVTTDVQPDGILHRRLSGPTSLSPVDRPWRITSRGLTLQGWSAPIMTFELDAFLLPSGASRLTLVTSEFNVLGHSGQQSSSLSFTMTCACSGLYTAPISEATLRHYQTVEGSASVSERTYLGDYPDGHWDVIVDRHVIDFSSGARPVPEPPPVIMFLMGLAVLRHRKWRALSGRLDR